MKSIDEIKRLIASTGIEASDRHDHPDSQLRFPDGAHYRNEISGTNSVQDLLDIVDERTRRGVPIHRIIMGASQKMDRGELREIVAVAAEHRLEIVMDPGPKSITDIGRHSETPFGKWGGWRIRGADNFARLIQSILRAREVGFRAFLLYDEGALMVLGQLRERGEIPKDTIFKMSYTAGYRSPAGAKLIESLGADSFNPVTDLTVAMFAALRQTVKIPLDIVIYGWETLGNVSRELEAPEIIRVAAPCYLKQELHGEPRTKVKYCEIIREIIDASYPELTVSKQGPDDLMVPMPL
jgi:hypothetical protein